jgi:hypothetical protein
MSDALDLHTLVDPSPIFEHDVLKASQAQLGLGPVFEQLAGALATMSQHLAGINDAVKQMIGALKGVQIDPRLSNLVLQLGSLFEIAGKAVHSQCMVNINVFKTIHFPAYEKVRSDFVRSSADCQKELEEWGKLEPKVKPDILAQHENAIQHAMCTRAAALHALTNFVDRTTETTLPTISFAVTTFLTVFVQEFSTFLSSHSDPLKEISSASPSKAEIFKRLLEPVTADKAFETEAYRFAEKYWAVRRNQVTASDDLARPSGVVWLHRRAWVRRFCQFKDGVMNFYDPSTGALDQSYPLTLVTVAPVQKDKRRFVLKVQFPTTEIILIAALSQFDVSEWISVITQHNERMILGTGPAPASGDAAPADGVRKCCVDCGAPEASWCSLNWAASICLKCSGTHRQMGVTVSKVRSVQLDKLHPYIEDMLLLMSNAPANALLLAAPCDVEVGPRMDDLARTGYILRKYQKLDWAVKTPPPDPFEAITSLDFMGLFHALNFGRADEKCEGLSPLHAAVQSGDALMVTIAACCVQDLDVLDAGGWTPLCYALFYGENEIAHFLLSLGAKPEKAAIDAGLLALYNGDRDLADTVLLTSKSDPSTTVFRPSSTRFASERNAPLVEIVVPAGTKQLSKMYRETVLC